MKNGNTVKRSTIATASLFLFVISGIVLLPVSVSAEVPAGSSFYAKAFDVAPTDISLSANTVAENQIVPTPIGTFSTTDPDVGDIFTYTLASGSGDADNGSFTIVGNTLSATASFNFETKNSYAIRVRSTDLTLMWVERTFTINVTNVNEAPTDIALTANTILENLPSIPGGYPVKHGCHREPPSPIPGRRGRQC